MTIYMEKVSCGSRAGVCMTNHRDAAIQMSVRTKETWVQTEIPDATDRHVAKVGHACEDCGITFANSVMYRIHFSCHSAKNPWVCTLCGEDQENAIGFIGHLTLHGY